MTLVTFTEDVFPHVRGEVIDLSDAEKERVDAQVKLRGLESAYKAGDHAPKSADNEGEVKQARHEADSAAVRENMVDQAAQLEAQRTAVAEPANVEALGAVAEVDQVVTGNKPVDDVEVENPQEAVDLGKDEGAQVKGEKKAKK